MPTDTQTVQANGIDIAYETFGASDAPPVLLVMGLGVQMLGWDEEFCQGLADRGFHVIRFDNRDVGLSTHLHDAPEPDLMAVLGGDTSSASYQIEDMADDAAGLMDALGLESAHVVGVSMGGMIAQTLAVRHPERVRTLTSIMSTTGEPGVSQAKPEATAALLAPPAPDREGAIQSAVNTFKVIGSPGFPYDEERMRDRAARSYDRANDPRGMMRQLVGIYASGDRTEALRAISAPTLVIHGREDPLLQLMAGEATAKAIPDAELMVIDGMGHDLPVEVWDRVIGAIEELAARGETAVTPT